MQPSLSFRKSDFNPQVYENLGSAPADLGLLLSICTNPEGLFPPLGDSG